MNLTDDDFDMAPARFPVRKRQGDYVIDGVEDSNEDIKSLLNISAKGPVMRPDAMNSEVSNTANTHLANLAMNLPDAMQHDDIEDEEDDEEESEYEDQSAESAEVAVYQAAGSLMANADDLEWYPANQLPGMRDEMIDFMGKKIFQNYTSAPISNIYAASTLSNPENDVARIYSGLQKKGREIMDLTYDFEQVMPGYSADAKIYSFKGLEFLLVKDFAGHYIYAWDKKTSLLTNAEKTLIEGIRTNTLSNKVFSIVARKLIKRGVRLERYV